MSTTPCRVRRSIPKNNGDYSAECNCQPKPWILKSGCQATRNGKQSSAANRATCATMSHQRVSGTAKQHNEELAVQRTRPADDQATESIGQSNAANRATCAKMSHQRMSGTTRSGLSQTGSCWCQTFSYRARAQFSNVAKKTRRKNKRKTMFGQKAAINFFEWGGFPGSYGIKHQQQQRQHEQKKYTLL